MVLAGWMAVLVAMSGGVVDQKVITKSGSVNLKEIVLAGGDTPAQAVVIVRGDGLTVDFSGTTRHGCIPVRQ